MGRQPSQFKVESVLGGDAEGARLVLCGLDGEATARRLQHEHAWPAGRAGWAVLHLGRQVRYEI